MNGLFRLRTPLDLLKKMEHHLEQLSTDPLNEYAAFDFFVAATHLPEWLGKVKCAPGKDKNPRVEAMKRICEHLASGAKHFDVDPKWHTSVQETTLSTPAIAGLARSGTTFSGGITRKLIIHLTPHEAAAMGVESLSAVTLAQQLVDYWKNHPQIVRAATRAAASNDGPA